MPLFLKAYCASLNSLFMRHNDLKQIPATLGLLESVKYLDLKGNPQRLVRANILDKSGGEIIVYLHNRLTPEKLLTAESRVRDIIAMSSTQQQLDSLSPVATTEIASDAQNCRPVSGEEENSKQASSSVPRISDEMISPVGDEGPLPLKKNIPSSASDAQVAIPSDQGKNVIVVKASSHPSKEQASESQEQQEKTVSESPSSIADELRRNIDALSQQLEHLGLSQAKRYALKKQLAMERSKLIREERRLAQGGV